MNSRDIQELAKKFMFVGDSVDRGIDRVKTYLDTVDVLNNIGGYMGIYAGDHIEFHTIFDGLCEGAGILLFGSKMSILRGKS